MFLAFDNILLIYWPDICVFSNCFAGKQFAQVVSQNTKSMPESTLGIAFIANLK